MQLNTVVFSMTILDTRTTKFEWRFKIFMSIGLSLPIPQTMITRHEKLCVIGNYSKYSQKRPVALVRMRTSKEYLLGPFLLYGFATL